MNADNTARDPLTVPVSEATPQELEAQAAHHVTNVALATFKEFLEETDQNDAVINECSELVVIGFYDEHGNSLFDAMRIIRLCELDHGRQLVFFIHSTEGNARAHIGYGVVDANLRTLYEYSMERHFRRSTDVLRAALRNLNNLILCTRMVMAEESIQNRPES